MSATQPKPANPPALRVGIVLSGTVIAEEIVRDRRPLSIGTSVRATVQIPLSTLPRAWEILSLDGDAIRVRLAPGMDARIAHQGQVWTRRECDQHGTVAHGVTTLRLPLTAHGRLDLGEVRVLFQGVRLPAPAPRPTLPRALRGSLADRIDTRVATLAAASIVANLGLMIAAHVNDPPGEPTMARRATEQYREDTIAIIDASDPILVDQPPVTDPEPGAQTPTTPEPATPSRPNPSRPNPSRPAVELPAIDPTRAADLLFAPDGDQGRLVGDLAAKRPGSDLAQQLDEVRDGDQTATIGDQTGRVRPSTDPRIGTDPGPGLDPQSPQLTHVTKNPDSDPPVRIKPIVPQRPPGEPSINGIVSKVTNVYIGGLQRCYKRSLVDNPTLSGKLSVTFTVTDRGAVSDASATGVDDKLAACVEGLMKNWSFTPVVDEDGDPTDVDVRIKLQLTPH